MPKDNQQQQQQETVIITEKTQHVILHEKVKKISSANLKFAIVITCFWLVLDIWIYFTKDLTKEFFNQYPQFEDYNNFFNLDDWIQWLIFGSITIWMCLEIGLAKFLVNAVKNESLHHFKLWILIYSFDCIFAISVYITLICLVTTITQAFLGLFGIIICIVSIYYARIMFKYYMSLKTTTCGKSYHHLILSDDVEKV